MRFVFTHSHVFPGSRVTLHEDTSAEPSPACLVEFSDGVTVIGEWHRDGPEIALDIPGYRTARNHTVTARRWRLRKSADGGWRSYPGS
ncbi:hypothetical protein [Paenirhodobacter sp.]|uniref:hypothetical protein n=1 Tax=Paenirhodobacter sp. TaxID=1965326 RepID=UPI003B409011